MGGGRHNEEAADSVGRCRRIFISSFYPDIYSAVDGAGAVSGTACDYSAPAV